MKVFLAIWEGIPYVLLSCTTQRTNRPNQMKATPEQLETLRNLAANAEREGFAEAAKAGFISYSMGRTGTASQEEINSRIHGIREILRTYKGSLFADLIA
jgi:hypothetical protein